MRAKRLGIILAFLSAPVLAGGVARGQDWHQGRGRLEGTISSTKGEPIAGATVTLRYHGSGPDLKTDKRGRWAILGLTGGGWDIDVSAPGFQSKKISVTVNELTRNPLVNLSLEPEAKQEAPETEVRVGGKTISKEAAEAIDKGNAASKAKNYAEAEENYLKAFKELPDSPSLLSNLALNYYFDNKPEQALGFARKLTVVDPENTDAWLMIAELELQKGNLEAGREALAKVPEERITSPEPYMNVGILSYNKKKLPEADEAFSKAIAKNPDLAEAYFYRGLVRYQAKRTADAKADLQKSVELAPAGKDAETAREILKTIK
jgi:cytochrome c-type biogenesis protein CcmH/NrfG